MAGAAFPFVAVPVFPLAAGALLVVAAFLTGAALLVVAVLAAGFAAGLVAGLAAATGAWVHGTQTTTCVKRT